MLNNGWKMFGDNEQLQLKKGDQTVTFDIRIETSRRAIYCLYLKWPNEIITVSLDHKGPVNKDKFHRVLSHINDAMTTKIAKYFKLKLVPAKGKLPPCEH